MSNAAPDYTTLVPVPGPGDTDHLAAIGLLMGLKEAWAPKFLPADRKHVAKAGQILKDFARLPFEPKVEVCEGRLCYGPPTALCLLALSILVCWREPLLAYLTSPKRGARHG